MAYKSRVNLQIPTTPTTDNSDLFLDFQQIYNALHLLNGRFEQVAKALSDPLPTDDPNTSFILRSFWADAAENATEGRIVKPTATGFQRGATGTANVTNPFGIVLQTTNSEGKALIGWPPGIIPLEDATNVGDKIYTNAAGELTVVAEGPDNWPVGVVIQENFLLLQSGIAK